MGAHHEGRSAMETVKLACEQREEGVPTERDERDRKREACGRLGAPVVRRWRVVRGRGRHRRVFSVGWVRVTRGDKKIIF